MEYELLWRNKWLTAEATTLDGMIGALRSAADELEVMRGKGVALLDDGSQRDDYATLVTTDPAVAEEFGFLPAERDDDLAAEAENHADAPDTILEVE